MMQLLWADIYRDGGSYGAALADDEQRFSVLLQVNFWERPSKISYGNLYIVDGDNPTATGKKIEIGSIQERDWFMILEAADLYSSDVSTNCIERFTQLLNVLKQRTH